MKGRCWWFDGWRGNMLLRSKGAVCVTALVAHDEEDATGLWEAAGYSRDRQIARFVRNL